jgi:hypothetical protein
MKKSDSSIHSAQAVEATNISLHTTRTWTEINHAELCNCFFIWKIYEEI